MEVRTMTFQVFVSYAHRDWKAGRVDRFVDDLTRELAAETGADESKVLFVDRSGIGLGAEWERTLNGELGGCCVCLALCSPFYLGSEFCGKEYAIFLQRLEAAAGAAPRAILPLIWRLPKDELPPVVARFQYTHQDLPESYNREGLYQLANLTKYEDDYKCFVVALARDLAKLAKQPLLPPLPALPQLAQMTSAFHGPVPPAAGAPAPRGPDTARFAFVVGKRDEVLALRTFCEAYAEHGSWYWRPYLPATDKAVGLIAQEVASELQLRFMELAVGHDLCTAIEEAERNNELVVLLADAWTLRLDDYARLMRAYDKLLFTNTGLLVLWNDGDIETQRERGALEAAIRAAFPKKYQLQVPSHLWTDALSPGDLRTRLGQVLTEIRMRILKERTPVRRVESEALVATAQEQGIDCRAAAQVQGPVGAAA
jgi:FxsC-like protein